MLAVIQGICIVDRFDLRRLPPQIGDGFVHRHFRSHPGEARAHQAAGRILFVSEESDGLAPGGLVELFEQYFPLLPGSQLHQVRGVVGCKQTQPDPALAGGHALYQLELGMAVEVEPQIVSDFAREGREALESLLPRHLRPAIENALVA
jgi:hypothetical protein